MAAKQNPHKHARKKLFVSRKIQGRMLLKLALYWGVYHLVLWHAMFVYRYLQYRADVLGGATQVPFAELYSTFVTQHYSMILCAVGLFPIIFWDMVKVTHRIAGPLVRFQNKLRDMKNGERPEPIKLRKGDLLVDLQDAFNEYVAILDTKPRRESLDDTEECREREVVESLQEISSVAGGHEGDEKRTQPSPLMSTASTS